MKISQLQVQRYENHGSMVIEVLCFFGRVHEIRSQLLFCNLAVTDIKFCEIYTINTREETVRRRCR